ncbi:MAG: hypothetical protein AB1761_17775 [Pseudomonadota bacterium]
MTTRMLPPTDAGKRRMTVNGRSYVGTLGTVYDVPDHDADALEANGWTRVEAVGTTAERPNFTATPAGAALSAGRRFLDTTVGALIVWDGATWRNPATGAAV